MSSQQGQPSSSGGENRNGAPPTLDLAAVSGPVSPSGNGTRSPGNPFDMTPYRQASEGRKVEGTVPSPPAFAGVQQHRRLSRSTDRPTQPSKNATAARAGGRNSTAGGRRMSAFEASYVNVDREDEEEESDVPFSNWGEGSWRPLSSVASFNTKGDREGRAASSAGLKKKDAPTTVGTGQSSSRAQPAAGNALTESIAVDLAPQPSPSAAWFSDAMTGGDPSVLSVTSQAPVPAPANATHQSDLRASNMRLSVARQIAVMREDASDGEDAARGQSAPRAGGSNSRERSKEGNASVSPARESAGAQTVADPHYITTLQPVDHFHVANESLLRTLAQLDAALKVGRYDLDHPSELIHCAANQPLALTNQSGGSAPRLTSSSETDSRFLPNATTLSAVAPEGREASPPAVAPRTAAILNGAGSPMFSTQRGPLTAEDEDQFAMPQLTPGSSRGERSISHANSDRMANAYASSRSAPVVGSANAGDVRVGSSVGVGEYRLPSSQMQHFAHETTRSAMSTERVEAPYPRQSTSPHWDPHNEHADTASVRSSHSVRSLDPASSPPRAMGPGGRGPSAARSAANRTALPMADDDLMLPSPLMSHRSVSAGRGEPFAPDTPGRSVDLVSTPPPPPMTAAELPPSHGTVRNSDLPAPSPRLTHPASWSASATNPPATPPSAVHGASPVPAAAASSLGLVSTITSSRSPSVNASVH